MGDDNNLEPERNDSEPQGSTPPGSADEGEGAASAASAGLRGSEAQSLKGLTPGQRLAAKKAQKSVDKREFKAELKRKEDDARAEEQAEAQRFMAAPPEPELPDEVQKVAGDFSEFVQTNRGRILGGIAAVVLGSLAFIVIRNQLGTGSREQAALLTSAIEVANAGVDPDNTTGKTEDGKPVFKSREDRAKKAAEAFAVAAKDPADSVAAGWAKLGEAAVQVTNGQAAKAEPLYKAVTEQQAAQPALAVRAIEGRGIAEEAAGKADDAAKRYDELKALDKDLSEYHLARLKLAKGDRDGAKTLLKGVYDRLSNRAEGTPPSRYLKGEVEVRLSELDSSLVDKGASGSDGEQFSQEELQRLIQQLQQQQQKGGSPAGSGAE
jgi:hypothetical protein